VVATKKPKGLGRGLEALLGPRVSDAEAGGGNNGNGAASGKGGAQTPSSLGLSDLVPGMYQPRTRMDEGALYELAESIKAQGIMQPILVRRLTSGNNAGRYEIIAGERRFRAARLAGLDAVPVLVRDVPDEAAAAMSLIENIQREDLNPLEEAQGLSRLVKEFGLTHEQAAQAVGRSRSAASNLLRLLNLADPVQTMLMAGDLDMGHARALLALDRATQITAAHQIASRKLSVREAESLARRMSAEFNLTSQKSSTGAARGQKRSDDPKSADLRRVEEDLSDALMAQVEVRFSSAASRSKGGGPPKRGAEAATAGEVAIRFASIDELNGLLEKLQRAAAGVNAAAQA
jgi:ParB family chromosome partitioning protein